VPDITNNQVQVNYHTSPKFVDPGYGAIHKPWPVEWKMQIYQECWNTGQFLNLGFQCVYHRSLRTNNGHLFATGQLNCRKKLISASGRFQKDFWYFPPKLDQFRQVLGEIINNVWDTKPVIRTNTAAYGSSEPFRIAAGLRGSFLDTRC